MGYVITELEEVSTFYLVHTTYHIRNYLKISSQNILLVTQFEVTFNLETNSEGFLLSIKRVSYILNTVYTIQPCSRGDLQT